MRIKKTSQTTASGAQTVNTFSESTENAYSCYYANQKILKKLWENTNTTTSFSPQTITLSSEDYDYLVWIYRFNTTSNNNLQKSQLVLKGAGVIMDVAWDYGVGGSYTVADYHRKVQYTNNTTYSIEDCNIKYNNTQDAQDNNYIIPVAVYGAKF